MKPRLFIALLAASVSGMASAAIPPREASFDRAWQRSLSAPEENSRQHQLALRELRALAAEPDADAAVLTQKSVAALSHPKDREAALSVLIGLGPRATSAKPALFSALTEERELTGQLAVIDALLVIGITPADFPRIRELLKKDLPSETKRYLRFALGEEASPAPLSPTGQERLARLRAREIDPVALWHDPDERVREEAVDAFAAADLALSLKVRQWLIALADESRPVRAAGVRQLAGLPAETWLKRALALLRADRTTRAAVCQLLETASGSLASSRAQLKTALAMAITRFGNETEDWRYSAESVWRALGVEDADKPVLMRLLKDRKLGPLRRAQVIRLAAELPTPAPELNNELLKLVTEDSRPIPVGRQWERIGIDGDLTAAIRALTMLSPDLAAKARAILLKRTSDAPFPSST